MSKTDLASAYSMTPPPPGNARRTEAWALTQAALRLKAGQSADLETMRSAARLNWRLWTILQADLLDPNSPVPLPIRSNMLSLARFVDTQTVAFLADSDPAKLDVLISINRELAAGLHGAGQGAVGEQATADAPERPAAPTRLSI